MKQWFIVIALALSGIVCYWFPKKSDALFRMGEKLLSTSKSFFIAHASKRLGRDDAPAFGALLYVLFSLSALLLLEALAVARVSYITPLLLTPIFTLGVSCTRALGVRARLAEGRCDTAEETAIYEQQVVKTIMALGEDIGSMFFPVFLLASIGMFFGLPVTFGWGYLVIYYAKDDLAWAKKAVDTLSRAGDRIFAALLVPVSAVLGLEAKICYRALKKASRANSAQPLSPLALLSTVGHGEDGSGGHPPVAGDIAQVCLCVWGTGVATIILFILPYAFLL